MKNPLNLNFLNEVDFNGPRSDNGERDLSEANMGSNNSHHTQEEEFMFNVNTNGLEQEHQYQIDQQILQSPNEEGSYRGRGNFNIFRPGLNSPAAIGNSNERYG